MVTEKIRNNSDNSIKEVAHPNIIQGYCDSSKYFLIYIVFNSIDNKFKEKY